MKRLPAWCWIFLLYQALSFAFVANTWVLHPGAFIGGDGDPQLLIWNLGWTPFQLEHGNSPLVTDYISYPYGANLMWNGNMVVPAFLLWPVTALYGPVASYNVMVTLTPALSGFCAYLALRRYASVPASGIGGLLYAFSPYIVAQLGVHNHVALAVFPPLALLALDEIYVRQCLPPLLTGVLLGIATAAQYLTGEEVLATTVIMAAIGTLVLAAMHPHEVLHRVRHAATALGVAAGAAAVLSAYPLKVQFFGPNPVRGALQTPNIFVTDLGNLVVPSVFQRFHTDGAIAIQGHFTGNQYESDAYLGIPLMLLLVALAYVLRRSALARWCGIMLVAALVLSMGPHLHIDGKDTGIRLPWSLIGRGIFQSIIPSRLALYAFLMIAVAIALTVDCFLQSRRPIVTFLRLGAVALALAPLAPVTPFFQTEPENPSFFTSGDVQRIPAGSVAVVDPFASGSSHNVRAMLWQAQAGFQFRMPEGEAYRPGPALDPPHSMLQQILTGLETGHRDPVTSDVVAQIRAELRAFQVQTVIVGPSGHQAESLALFRTVLRDEPDEVGGVFVFWDAGHDVGL